MQATQPGSLKAKLYANSEGYINSTDTAVTTKNSTYDVIDVAYFLQNYSGSYEAINLSSFLSDIFNIAGIRGNFDKVSINFS